MHFCARSHRFREIIIYNLLPLKMKVDVTMYKIRNGVIQWQYMTSYLTAMVMCALSATIYEIFAKQINCQKFDLKNEGEGQRVEN